MAISYVGGQVGGRAGATSTPAITFALTGGSDSTPQAGDLVVITCVVGSQARNPAQAISGYTALGQLNPTATTYDTSLDVSWKVMGGTPDTTFILPSTGNVADGQSYAVQVFRGVDAAALTSASTTGTATSRPNPTSVTPTVAGSWVAICGGGAAATGANYVAPANFATNFLTRFDADTNDSLVGSGYWSGWTSGAVDPAQYTGGSTATTSSWAAYTLVLPPVTTQTGPVGRSDEAGTALTLTPIQHMALGRADEADTALALSGASALPTHSVRYIRDHANGSSGNGASYFCELEAYNAYGVNQAQGASVTANFTPSEGTLPLWVDGNTASASYAASPDANAQITVDLGSALQISGIRRWHYYADGRTFYSTKTETSVDGVAWTVIFDSAVSGTYAETADGKYNVTIGTGTPVGLAAETATALSLAPTQARPAGLAAGTDTALPRGAARPAGLAAETATALTLAGSLPAGLAVETAAALARAPVQTMVAGAAAEIATALPRGAARPAGLASASDTALTLASSLAAEVSIEVGTALPRGAARPVGLAAETGTALSLAAAQARSVGLAAETGAALALAGSLTLGVSAETDAAAPLAAVQVRGAGVAAETGAALPLAAVQAQTVGLAVEVGAPLTLGAARTVGVAGSAEAALALAASVNEVAIGQASETNLVFALPSRGGDFSAARGVGRRVWDNRAVLWRRR